MATKGCSTGMLNAFLDAIRTKGGGNLRIVLMASSGASWPITIVSASSNSTGCLAQSTGGAAGGAFPTSDEFVLGSCGDNQYITVPACSCDLVLQTDEAAYVAIIEDSSSIRYVTTCTTQAVTSGNKVNIGTWSITINQPT